MLLCLGATTIFFLGFHVFDTSKLSISLLFIVIDIPFSLVFSVALMKYE